MSVPARVLKQFVRTASTTAKPNWASPHSHGASSRGASSATPPPAAVSANTAAPAAAQAPASTPAVPDGSTLEASSSFDTVAIEQGSPAAKDERDWTTSFWGMSSQAFPKEVADILMRPLQAHEIEIKPDGLLYLPEILYRRILNQAFGPGGWGMVPRGELTIIKNVVSREWGLLAGGRLISVARGEQTFFDQTGLPTATEGCKSNALMRCCKDLGIASELWDPSFIRQFKAQHCAEVWTEHASTKKKQKRWRKKGAKFDYPLTEV